MYVIVLPYFLHIMMQFGESLAKISKHVKYTIIFFFFSKKGNAYESRYRYLSSSNENVHVNNLFYNNCNKIDLCSLLQIIPRKHTLLTLDLFPYIRFCNVRGFMTHFIGFRFRIHLFLSIF